MMSLPEVGCWGWGGGVCAAAGEDGTALSPASNSPGLAPATAGPALAAVSGLDFDRKQEPEPTTDSSGQRHLCRK